MDPKQTPTKDVQRRLGARIETLMRERGLSKAEVERVHGFSRTHLQKLVRGDLNVTLATLVTIADILGVSLAALLHGVYPAGEDQE